MSDGLDIAVHWERLDEGSAQERACFGMLTFRCGDLLLTEGLDGFVDRAREGPLVSGYHLAEWMAWNWWRLVVEPRSDRQVTTEDWCFAHRLATIGDGYVWPNITIFSDRERTVLLARPTPMPKGFAPFRYTADWSAVVPTREFEAAVDRLMEQVQGQLRAKSVAETNLDRIWEEVRSERADPVTSVRRRLEALLGFDPDEGPADAIESLLADARELGQDAIQEVAASHPPAGGLIAADLKALAKACGTDTKPADAIHIATTDLPPRGRVPGWRLGYEAARAVRRECGLELGPLSSDRLAELCAVSPRALEPSSAEASAGAGLAFALDDERRTAGRIVLRSKWEEGRRFELARLLGDRVASGLHERLLPSTRAYTYRQKVQRAFAAELLCPFEALEEALGGDYSPEARADAARHFCVSDYVVTHMLVNHKRLDWDGLDLIAYD
jgi:hypothetical protein